MSAHKSLPSYKSLQKPTLDVLEKLGGSGTIDEINEKVIEQLGLTDEQLGITYPGSGALVVQDRLSWARSYLKIAGYIVNERKGVWVLTDEGRERLSWTAERIEKHVVKVVRESSQQKPKEAGDEALSAESVSAASWSDKLLAAVGVMTPVAFERLCQRILRESGFTRVEVTGKSGDGGIDGVGVLRVQLVSFHVLFQCKRWKGSVGAEVVRNFRGAMQGRADKGIIITTGAFTADAKREATRDGAPAIDLIDGEGLCYLLKELRLGVSVQQIITEEVVVSDAFFEGV